MGEEGDEGDKGDEEREREGVPMKREGHSRCHSWRRGGSGTRSVCGVMPRRRASLAS